MKSSWLKDALSEIDSSCDYVTIVCNPPQKTTGTGQAHAGDAEAPIFRIEAKSMRGSVEVSISATVKSLISSSIQMDYPNDREVLEYFECGQSIQFQCVSTLVR